MSRSAPLLRGLEPFASSPSGERGRRLVSDQTDVGLTREIEP